MEIREYQQNYIDKTIESFENNNKCVLLVMPTGSGKTFVFSQIVKKLKKRTLIVSHRNLINSQIKNTLEEKSPIVMTIQSVNKLNDFKEYELLVIDEGHHITENNMWGKLYDKLHNNCKVLLVTATPTRNDGKIFPHIDDTINLVTQRSLINNGYLSDFEIYAPNSTIDLSLLKLSQKTKDYTDKSINSACKYIVGDIVESYYKYLKGERAIVFVTSVELANTTLEQFTDIDAQVITAKTLESDRESF